MGKAKQGKSDKKAAIEARQLLAKFGVEFPQDLADKFGEGGAEVYGNTAADALRRLETATEPSDRRGATIAFYRRLDRDLSASEGPLRVEGELRQIACRAGCNYCCAQEVTTIPIEAELVVHYVHNQFSPEEQQALKARVAAYNAQPAGAMCPLNQNGQCSVYAVRPTPCRAFHSYNVEPCKTIPTGKQLPAPVNPQRQAYTICHTMAFRDAVGQVGLPTETVRLTDYLATYL
ncbi:MAG: YkgJ family cysteine cluster protein [Chthonomonas sp.]|nr:YkgJ family cysteine cluster protein [Chthonomonas sp.]